MTKFNKKHDPATNERLLSAYLDGKTVTDAAKETVDAWDKLFKLSPGKQLKYSKPFSFLSILAKLADKIVSFFIKAHSGNEEMPRTIIDKEGRIFPEWKPRLDLEFIKLKRKVKRVNVADYGAIGDGLTDCTEAFKEAIGKGNVQVDIPIGVYIIQGIKLPSSTILNGAGRGETVLKLHDKAPKRSWLVTNANHAKGNSHVCVRNLTLDWNIERLDGKESTSAGNNRSSCLTYANVTYGWVAEVEAINPGLHCFDISSTVYTYSGDGTRASGGSRFIWLDRLTGYGFGDDGITTHHSDCILISNSHMCDPSGRAHNKGFSNSNGFEVDDGSRHVWLVNNSSARCFGGVEIKAHATSSAAANVHIFGHLSINDNRSYNFRHIGHHSSTDPESSTAYNITAVNIVSVAPVYSELYQDSSPRSLVVSAYKNVMINYLTAIGDPDYDYKGNPVIAIQYKARNIDLNHVTVKGFAAAGADIKVFGGDNKADIVAIRNVRIEESAKRALVVGPGIKDISLQQIFAFRKDGDCGCLAETPFVKVTGFYAEGYKEELMEKIR